MTLSNYVSFGDQNYNSLKTCFGYFSLILFCMVGYHLEVKGCCDYSQAIKVYLVLKQVKISQDSRDILKQPSVSDKCRLIKFYFI